MNTKPKSHRRVKGRGRVGRAPLPGMVAGTEPLASSAGGALLVQTARATGLDRGLSRALGPWRPLTAVHEPGKVVLDLAGTLALGGDCLADIAVLRAQPAVFGRVASDPTVSRTVDRLAAGGDAVLTSISRAAAAARAAAWAHRSPVPAAGPVMVDLDATVVVSHSEKESAAPTFKRTFGFHPLLAFVDHGPTGVGGEVLAGLLRPGNANANNSADHITVLDMALAQLPEAVRSRVTVRADSGGGTKAFLTRITNLGLQYSIGIGTAIGVDQHMLSRLPGTAWTQAYDPDGRPRDGAQVAELTGMLPGLTGRGWPAGMRVIARRERPHPGAQLRLTDLDGWRITTFATNTRTGQLATLEVTHRLRARAEDRIRTLKDLGLRNLPLHDTAQNRVWLAAVLLAQNLLTWTAHPGPVPAPGSGTQTAPAPAAQRRRPDPHHRPPDHPPATRPLALGHRAAHRAPTTRGPARTRLSHPPPRPGMARSTGDPQRRRTVTPRRGHHREAADQHKRTRYDRPDERSRLGVAVHEVGDVWVSWGWAVRRVSVGRM